MKLQQLQVQEFDANHAENEEIEFGSYSSGVYFLVFKRQNGEVVTRRIVKR